MVRLQETDLRVQQSGCQTLWMQALGSHHDLYRRACLMSEYSVRIFPAETENFYTVAYAVESAEEVWVFSDIPYKIAFGAQKDPDRGLDILRAYEAFEALMLMENPSSEAEILSQRLDKLGPSRKICPAAR